MRKIWRALVAICAAIFVANLVIMNTLYRNREMSDDVWFVVVMLGLFGTAVIAIGGLGMLVATRPRVR